MPSAMDDTPAQTALSEPEKIPDDQDIDFVTFGMLIIDDIEFPPPKPAARDVLGGAGTFAALGARLLSPGPSRSRTVGWVVDRGGDFPASADAAIASWRTSALVRDDAGRQTTRGWNGYDDPSDPGRRSFRYATPKLRLTPADLAAAPALLRARAVHVISSPARCRDVVAALSSLRRRAMGEDEDYSRPLVIWEPVPDRCGPDELLELTNTLPLVDVCSPNHAELAALMGDVGPGAGLTAEGDVDAAAVERACEQLLASMPLSSFAVVVRAGPRGCYVARNGGRRRRRRGKSDKDEKGGGGGQEEKTDKKKPKPKPKPAPLLQRGGLRPDTDMEALFAGLMQEPDGSVARDFDDEPDPGVERWFPAYFQGEEATTTTAKEEGEGGGGDGPEEKQKAPSSAASTAAAAAVVDPTGGGNAFLGGLAVAMARGRPAEDAALWATVAASFAIEQVGLPVLAVGADGSGETWNGVRVEDRVGEYFGRLGINPEGVL
ncbi:hypothetical protein RB595_006474 [Gaeumannomyces hyphopodioides]